MHKPSSVPATINRTLETLICWYVGCNTQLLSTRAISTAATGLTIGISENS